VSENINKNNNEAHSYLTYTLAALTAILFSVGIYFYTSYEIISKDDFKNNYKQKSTINFDDLSYATQDEYTLKSNIPFNNTQELINQIENLNAKLKNQKVKTIVNTKIVKDIQVVKDTTIVTKLVSTNSFNVNKFNVAKCYDMKTNDDQLSSTCAKDILSFLNKNKDAKYFEVIGLLSNEDFLYLKKFKKNLDVLTKLNVTPSIIDRLEKFADVGLSSKRVEETIWFINQNSKTKLNIFPTNYTITSKSHNKGTIVRAYY